MRNLLESHKKKKERKKREGEKNIEEITREPRALKSASELPVK